MTIDPMQMRAARAALNWSADDLAAAANVGLATVRRFERGDGTPISNNMTAMRSALEKAGVIFLPAEGNQSPGIRLTKKAWTTVGKHPR